MKTFAYTLTAVVSFTLVASASLAGPQVRELPRSDALRKIVDAVGTPLRDGVISTGHLGIRAMALVPTSGRPLTNAALGELTAELARPLVKDYSDEPLPAGFRFDTTVAPFKPGQVMHTARIISEEVNAYDPKAHAEREISRTLWVMLNRLGVKDGSTVVASSRAVYRDEESGPMHVTVTMFLNKATKKMVVFSMAEGRM
jgi:hypothetical protein